MNFVAPIQRLSVNLAICLVGAVAASSLPGQTNSFPSSGAVGIGTTTPNTTLPSLLLDIRGNINIAGNGGNIYSAQPLQFLNGQGAQSIKAGSLWVSNNYSGTAPANGAYTQGVVGIGTVNPPCTASNAPANCLLAVNGAIQAQAVVVNTGWSDYVFQPAYKLAPLSEVAGFIESNHHLPDIPSASEVAQKGLDVGDMQAKLLAKIEELTLHMIRVSQRNDELSEENLELERRISQLESKGKAEAARP